MIAQQTIAGLNFESTACMHETSCSSGGKVAAAIRPGHPGCSATLRNRHHEYTSN